MLLSLSLLFLFDLCQIMYQHYDLEHELRILCVKMQMDWEWNPGPMHHYSGAIPLSYQG